MLLSQEPIGATGGYFYYKGVIMGFTKLDSGILDSSIWSESLATRVVWIAFLAKADQNGFVAASRSGMLRAANVPEPDFDSAITSLESPDPDSRTSDNNGRRIEKVEGGWIVLNYTKYRKFTYSGSDDAERKRKYRGRKINDLNDNDETLKGHVPKSMGHSASASASVSASDIKEKENIKEKGKKKPKTQPPWRSSFEEYMKNAKEELTVIVNDKEKMNALQKLIEECFSDEYSAFLTIRKALRTYWFTERGWKKKKSTKSVKIDWYATCCNIVSQEWNIVKKPRDDDDYEDYEDISVRFNG